MSRLHLLVLHSLGAVDMRRAKSKTVVDQGGIDESALLRKVEQVVQVRQVSKAASNTVSRAILVQHKYLSRTKPSQRAVLVLQPKGQRLALQQAKHLVVVELARVRLNKLVHSMLASPIRV